MTDGTVRARPRYRAHREPVETSTAARSIIWTFPQQLVSVASAMIPFLENDDANRALMGSNMQRQAVAAATVRKPPTWRPASSTRRARFRRVPPRPRGRLRQEGFTPTRSSSRTSVRDLPTSSSKFARSNQSTCINQRPIVSAGEKVLKGDVIADGRPPTTAKSRWAATF